MLLTPESVLYLCVTINFLVAVVSRNAGYSIAEYGYNNKIFAGVSDWHTEHKMTDSIPSIIPLFVLTTSYNFIWALTTKRDNDNLIETAICLLFVYRRWEPSTRAYTLPAPSLRSAFTDVREQRPTRTALWTELGKKLNESSMPRNHRFILLCF